MFLHRVSAKKKRRFRKSYGLRKTLESLGESMVSSPQSWQRVTATQRGSQRTLTNRARFLLKTLECLIFPDGPQPKSNVSLGMLLVPRAESYVLLETLEVIGFPYISTWNYAWPIEGSIVFSRQGTQGRVCCQKRNNTRFLTWNLGKPYRSPSYMASNQGIIQILIRQPT